VRQNIPQIRAQEAGIIRLPDGIYLEMASTRVPATAVLRFEETTLFFKRPSLTRERLEGFLNQLRFTQLSRQEVRLC